MVILCVFVGGFFGFLMVEMNKSDDGLIRDLFGGIKD